MALVRTFSLVVTMIVIINKKPDLGIWNLAGICITQIPTQYYELPFVSHRYK